MIKKSVTIGLADGLEARPIAMLVQTATKFSSSVYLGVMSLGLLNGDSITIETNGEDEVGALEEIEKFLAGK